MDIGAWLRGLGLERYEPAFRAHHIDGRVLPRMTAEDLAALGVASIGHRRRLLEAIAALSGGSTAAGAVRDQARPHPASPPVPRNEGERRQLTVMFVDLVGSTALSARLDPEEMGEILKSYQDAVSAEIARFKGQVGKFMGDGVLAYFGWPRAYEDAAERAVRAGLAALDAVGRLRTGDGEALAARVGIATGLVVVGHLIGQGASKEETVVGETPNLAARLQELAEPGGVVVAESTRRLLGALFEFEDLGNHALRGFAGKVAAWRVAGEGRAESRFEALYGQRLASLVGREQELALLLSRWDRARRGEGQAVLLAGEAGIGKSRLVQALRERLAGQPHVSVSSYGSPHHSGSALWPVIDHLTRAAEIAREDAPATRLAKLEALLRQAVDDPGEAVALLAALLSIPAEGLYAPPRLPPQRQKERTFAVLLDQLAGLAARLPVLVVFEDAHWFDSSTLELVDRVIERIEHQPVMVLLTSRPAISPSWAGRPHVASLTLRRLGRRHSAALVGRVSGGKRLPPEVAEGIVARADGVPLFVEELTKAVLESSLLRDEGDRYELAGGTAPSALAIPSTLHDSLTARLDRLASVREVAQVGACIGRMFGYELLAAVAPLGEAELRDALRQLCRSELVACKGRPPEATYTFKHALVQEAAYQGLLKSRRQHLHREIARALLERFPATVEATPELLAHHYTEAGQAAPAVEFWLKAGRRAALASASKEAVAHLTQGLAVLNALPDTDARARQEIDLQLALGAAVRAALWFTTAEARPIYGRALELAERLGLAAPLVHALRGLWGVTYVAGGWRRARELATRAGEAVRRTNDPVASTVANFMSGVTLYYQGKFVAARSALEAALGFYDPDDHREHVLASGMDNGVHALNHLGLVLWMLGHPDAAERAARQALASARELAHPISTGLALHFACHVHEHRREWDSVARLADELAALGARHGVPHFRAWALTQKGAARISRGDLASGVAALRQGSAELREAGDEVWRPFYATLLVGALKEAGRTEEAFEALGEAEAIVGRGEREHEAEVHRTAGELLLTVPGRRPEAETRLRRALRVARAQRAASWELRAATSLARVRAERGERGRARRLLAPVYGRFAEGLDTPDLRDARGLLDSLA